MREAIIEAVAEAFSEPGLTDGDRLSLVVDKVMETIERLIEPAD